MSYTQLTTQERYVICHMNMAGFKPAAIARQLARHRGTISRELERNRSPYAVPDGVSRYFYDTAERLSHDRRDRANRRYKLDDADSPLGRYVREGLSQRWSPQQIAGRFPRDHRRSFCQRVTPETIYRWVYRRSELGEHWHEQLRRRHRRRRRRIPGTSGGRGQIPGRIGIEQRPPIVNVRGRFGDWESDTLEGAKSTGLLVTHVERKSRYLRLAKLDDKRAATLTAVSCDLLADLPDKLRRTLTTDNGKEFADFATIEQSLKVKVFFADPHAPWQRGTNENTNGLLRDFFPKGSDFRRISNAEVAKVQRMMNNRPRKCLNYRTPAEVLALPGVALWI